MFNVIHIEAKIETYRKIDEFRFNIEIGKLEYKLRFLTGFYEPPVLLKIWHSGNLVKSNMTFDQSVNTPWQDDLYTSHFKKRKN